MTIQELIKNAEIVELTEAEVNQHKERGELSRLLFEAYEKQDFADFYEALGKAYQITDIHPDMKDFIEATVMIKRIKGAACLGGVSQYLDMGLRPFEGYLENFPGLYVHSDIWVMMTNTRVVTLHHDATFYEVADDVEQEVDNRKDFLDKFSAEGSFLNLKELLLMNENLKKFDFKGCWNTVTGLNECKMLLQAIKVAKNLNYDQLARLVDQNSGSGYLYEVAMEFYELLEDEELDITAIEELDT
ncbi:MAG TPA: hypothetical protein DCS93_01225 [Microscillaceae bacterium]|nr:hypothetical protein [Microscillaceae bacterium]